MFNVFVQLCQYDSFSLTLCLLRSSCYRDCYWGYVGRFLSTLEGVLSSQQWTKVNKDSIEHQKKIKNRGGGSYVSRPCESLRVKVTFGE